MSLSSPHLWKRFGWQKEGILDMAMNLNSNADVAIDLQRLQKYWTKRQLFYLAKMYTGSLKAGHNYDKLRRCVSIGILNFHLRALSLDPPKLRGACVLWSLARITTSPQTPAAAPESLRAAIEGSPFPAHPCLRYCMGVMP